MNTDPPRFKEYAGVLIAFCVVLAFVAIGFVQFAAGLFVTNVPTISEAWMSAMLSLASAALGFLIGKADNKQGG